MATAAELDILFKADPSGVRKAQEQMNRGFGGMQSKAKMAGMAIAAGLAVGAVGAGVAAVKIGQDFEAAYNTIRVGTGATGQALEDLKDDFRAVFADVPADAAFVSSTLADLNTRLGVTGPLAQDLTKKFAQLQQLGVDASVEGFTRAMGDWSIANDQAADKLDKLFVISQATGPSIEEIQRLVVQFGAPMRNFGFSFDESAALLAKWQKEGVNTELVMGSLRIAAGKFAKEGTDLRTGLEASITAIKEAGSSSEATALAMETFGARAGADMADAIRGGKFAIDEFLATLEGSEETIDRASQATLKASEKFQILKNRAKLALEPVASLAVDGLTLLADVALSKTGPALERLSEISQDARDVWGMFLEGFNLEPDMGWLDRIQNGLGGLFGTLEGNTLLVRIFGPDGGAKVIEIGQTLSDGLTTVQGALDDVRDAADPWITKLQEIFDKGDLIAGLLTGTVAVAFAGLAAVVAPVIGTVVGLLGTVLAPVLAVAAVVVLLKKAWENNWGDIHGKTAAVIAWFKANVVPTVQAMVAKAMDLVRGLVAFWQDNWGAISTILQGVLDVIVGNVRLVFGTLKGIVEAGLALLRGDWEGFGDAIRGIWTNLGDSLGQIARGYWSVVKGAFTLFKDNAVGFMKRAGSAIIDGLTAALEIGKELVVNTLMGIARGAVGAFKSFFGIGSPSRLMQQLGFWVMEGLALGIQAGGSLARERMDDAIRQLADIRQEAARLRADLMALTGGRGADEALAQIKEIRDAEKERWDARKRGLEKTLRGITPGKNEAKDIARLIEAEQRRFDELMAHLDEQENAIRGAYDEWKAAADAVAEAHQAAEDAIREAQRAAEEGESRIHDQVMSMLEEEMRRREGAHQAILDQLAAQKARWQQVLDAQREHLDDMKLALERLKMDLGIDAEKDKLQSLQGELDRFRSAMGDLEVLSGDPRKGRQDAIRRSRERVRLATEEQRTLLRDALSRGLVSDEDRRTVELLLLGYKGKAEDVERIMEQIAGRLQDQVDGQQAIVTAKEAAVKAAEDEIARAELLAKVEAQRIGKIMAGLDARVAAENKRWDAEKQAIEDAMARERERHAARMEQIAAEYALELARLDATDEEIQAMVARAMQRARAISEEAGRVYRELLGGLAQAGEEAARRTETAFRAAAGGTRTVLQVVRSEVRLLAGELRTVREEAAAAVRLVSRGLEAPPARRLPGLPSGPSLRQMMFTGRQGSGGFRFSSNKAWQQFHFGRGGGTLAGGILGGGTLAGGVLAPAAVPTINQTNLTKTYNQYGNQVFIAETDDFEGLIDSLRGWARI